MKKALVYIFLSFIILETNAQLIKKGASPIEVSNQFKFTEGPAVDKAGNVYFTDQPNNRIWKYDINGKLSLFMEDAGRSNGLFFDNEDKLISCADDKTELWSIDTKTKEVEVLLSKFENKNFNGPNDLWIAKNGYIYFTDPFYARPWWNYKEMPQAKKNVYLFKPKTNELTIVASNFVQPNGIIGDNKVIYVADIGDKKTYRYDILADGTLSERTLFCEMGSDGMTLDNKGNLYITGQGVTVFAASGEKIQNIEIPQKWSANVTFGGKKQKTLFVTASTGVYILPMKVKGIR
ncbi:gluconolactonase [Spirosomataceae bacterium TFI 002]|nr:gluconolactonase [Spirosomataceae bacterium TFI 002]